MCVTNWRYSVTFVESHCEGVFGPDEVLAHGPVWLAAPGRSSFRAPLPGSPSEDCGTGGPSLMSQFKPLDELREKLRFLQTEEAKAASALERYELQRRIRETKERIEQLEA